MSTIEELRKDLKTAEHEIALVIQEAMKEIYVKHKLHVSGISVDLTDLHHIGHEVPASVVSKVKIHVEI